MRLGTSGILSQIRPYLTNESLEAIGCTANDTKGLLRMAYSVLNQILGQREAAWWIKSRDIKLEDMFGSATMECIAYWRKSQPFKIH